MRRLVPWWVLALVFVVVPVVEIYVLIRIGQTIGAWWTVLLLVADGFLGSWLMKHEGARAWTALREAVESRRMPARELADAALILVGGTLLVTPGFVSDIAGLFCVLPFTRPVARRALTRFLSRKFLTGPGAPGFRGARDDRRDDPRDGPRDGSSTGSGRARQSPGTDGVVRGEVVD